VDKFFISEVMRYNLSYDIYEIMIGLFTLILLIDCCFELILLILFG